MLVATHIHPDHVGPIDYFPALYINPADYGIDKLYPGHYFGANPETKQRVDDILTLSKGVLSGKLKGEKNPDGMLGLNLIISDYGVRINYNETAVK